MLVNMVALLMPWMSLDSFQKAVFIMFVVGQVLLLLLLREEVRLAVHLPTKAQLLVLK
jgi:hypothetical protein